MYVHGVWVACGMGERMERNMLIYFATGCWDESLHGTAIYTSFSIQFDDDRRRSTS